LAVVLLGAAGTVHLPVVVPGLDIGIKQFDAQYGTMVAEVPCTVPYYFVNGTVAQAGQVNANFQALLNCLSTIYASDIIPTSAAQATFGGTLQYNFPAGVAVAGGQSYPYTTVTGPLWLYATKAQNSNFGITTDMNLCGNVGANQFDVSEAQIAYIDCNGGYNNQYGSIVANTITAGNGKFASTAGNPLILCAGPCSSGPQISFATSGNATFPDSVYVTLPSPAAAVSPGPAIGCWAESGQPCNQNFHAIHNDTATTVTLASSCPVLTLCNVGSTGAITFPSGLGFTNITYSCSATNNDIGSNAISYVQWINGTSMQIQIFNVSTTALPNSHSFSVNWECDGR
jgi:hypothetical protein